MDKPFYFCYNEFGDHMIQKWMQELTQEDMQLLLPEIAKKASLSRAEYVNLIDILFYHFVVNGTLHTTENITFIVNKIIENRNLIQKNQNSSCFTSCLEHFLKQAYEVDPKFTRLEEFLASGFLFHSFNKAFYPTIEEKGLVLKEKPWDLEKIEQIRNIFKKAHQKNIFGYYQGREETPIFFSSNLVSSPYYGLSSPTFFRKFVEHKAEYFNAFLNRDYESALASIKELILPLQEEEKRIVFSFFQEYWQAFATEELPCVAISTKEKLGIKEEVPPKIEEDSISYYLKRIVTVKNYMIGKNIDRESLEIFDYQTLSFFPKQKEKNI